MGSLDPVDVDIVVGEDGTSDRSDSHSLVLDAEFVNDFGQNFVNDTVAAPGTVVSVCLDQKPRTRVNFIFGFDYFFV